MSLDATTWPQAIEQIFKEFEPIENATPDWLEVYGTGRRLMVDRLYTRIGIAIWFRGYHHGLKSDDGTLERLLVDLCRRAGFSLVILDAKGKVQEQGLKEIYSALNSSSRLIAQQTAARQAQLTLLPRLAAAKAACQQMRQELTKPKAEPQARSRLRQRRERTRASMRQFQSSWRVFASNRLALLGLIILLAFALVAILYPLLLKTVWPPKIYNPNTGFDISVAQHPSSPSTKHILGTDAVGRDVLSVLFASTTPAFIVGLTAAITAAIIGTLVGGIAAYIGGALDTAFMQVADGFLLLPAPLLMIVVGSTFNDMSPAVFGVIYGIVAGLSGAAIVIRSHALTIKAKPFIEAARVAGGSGRHVFFRHVIPHLLPLAAIFMMVTATGAVISDGFVSFLGITRIHHNWGNMIFWSFAYQATVNATVTWNVLIPPAIAFSLFASSFYLISQGLQQVADPKLRDEAQR